MRFGTPEQQALHLPAIAAGDVIWCQGFSEPDAGSDLASLTTRAAPDPAGGWRITGQKVWTSYALMAQWCILAARTAVKAVKHEGITMFLVPMESQGITVRPIPNLLGPHHLNELFLDEVRVGPDDVLGGVDEGWSVIREALKFERIGIARYARCDRLLTLLRLALGERWADLPEALRARWTRRGSTPGRPWSSPIGSSTLKPRGSWTTPTPASLGWRPPSATRRWPRCCSRRWRHRPSTMATPGIRCSTER